MTVLGLDIGGANIKAATAAGWAKSVPFPLWKSPETLADALSSLIQQAGSVDVLAVTMTGELADCFATKAEGVARILASVQAAAGDRRVSVWSTDGRFVTPVEANQHPFAVAAANWHALATWVGQRFPCRSGLLIDIGSTTTDIIPLRDGVPCPLGRTDLDRLLSSELVYSGVRRTPLAALAILIFFRGQWVPFSSELFATTHDLYLLLGDIPEDPTDTDTANGRPATRAAAEDRLVRMLCADRTEISDAEVLALAQAWADQQLAQIASAIQYLMQRQTTPSETIIVSGSGEFLARRAVELAGISKTAEIISLTEVFTPDIAEAACAYAVACLLTRRDGERGDVSPRGD